MEKIENPKQQNEAEPKTLKEANEVIKNLKEQYLVVKRRFKHTLVWLGASAVLLGGILEKNDSEKENLKDKLTDLKATVYTYQERLKDLDRLKDEKEPTGETYQNVRDEASQQVYADLNNADSHIHAIFTDLGIHLNPDDK